MTTEELYEALDIDCPQDFKFYENFESYIELSEDIDLDVLCSIFSKIEKDYLYEMIEGYFDGLINFVGEYASVFSMELEKEKKAILGLWENADLDYEDSVKEFVIEIENFRRFYSIDSEVLVTDSNSGEEVKETVLEAYWDYRGERFDGTNHSFDFSNTNYTVDEYMISINDLMDKSFDDEEEYLYEDDEE